MATKVLLPKFGQTVETSEIVQWTKQEGAAVKKGDILCEIATDKSSLEVESQYEGTLLKILLPPGKTAPVNCVMALIGTPGEALSEALLAECLASQTAVAAPAAPAETAVAAPAPMPAPAPVAAAPKPAPVAAPAPKPAAAPAPAPARDGRIFISPRARHLAETQHVAIGVLSGSGENGRIVEADVRDYLRAIGSATPAARVAAAAKGIDLRHIKGSGAGGRIGVEDLLQASIGLGSGSGNGKPAKKAKPAAAPLVAKTEKPSPMRKVIAANMMASSSTIPAFQLEITVDAASLIARRESDKAAGLKISYGDYMARAVGLAIRRFPAFAATWTDAGLQYADGAHVGFAVAVPGGLVVPVVSHCDSRPPADIAALSAGLVEKARTGKLTPADYSGAVFTLSNLGSFPVDRFVAIVPPGQSGIIAIGRIRDEVVVKNGGFFAAKLMSLTLSADHRYIDGADGAAFMAELKELLENAAGL
jgi:pyruvate dehydrogenase E2 component (dihydrolipoamide acetyltransferase)